MPESQCLECTCNSLDEIPPQPGSYILHLILDGAVELAMGRLGNCSFNPGSYFYIGSAHGPGGLKSRIHRHLKINKPRQWHIDWLRPYVTIYRIYFIVSQKRLECSIVEHISSFPEISIPIRGFGSSDCRSKCRAHLLYWSHQKDLSEINHIINASIPEKVFVIIDNSSISTH